MMELVYLWVEEYKNIKKQGFNFSPRFKCEFKDEYDENGKLSDKSELKITPKENPLKDFFGKNINVTAIVGENGSGKSNICSFLFDNLNNEHKSFDVNNYILILLIKNKVYVFSTIQNIHPYTIFISKYHIDKKENKTLKLLMDNFYVSLYDFKISTNSIGKNNKNKKQYFPNRLLSFKEISLFDSRLILNEILLANERKYFTNYFSPLEIKIRTNSLYNAIIDEKNRKKFLKIRYLAENIDKKMNNIDSILFVIYTYLSILFYENFHGILSPFNELKEISNLKSYRQAVKDMFNKIKSFYSEQKVIYPNINLKLDKVHDIFQYTEKLIKDKQIFTKIFNRTDFYTLHDNFYLKVEINKIQKNKNIFYFFENLPECFDISFIDSNKKISDNMLSSGEKSLLRVRYYLENLIRTKKKDFFIIIFDELENELHPQWQVKLLKYLNDIFKDRKEKMHFILNSHSPFILSDLPKENVIFLEKGKQVYPFEDNQQTFGANIHTLLSHGFFMKDGLIGEFAKERIQSIIKYHEELLKKDLTKEENKKQRDKEKEKYEEKLKKEFWQIQSIIGDDYLKQVIKNHLVEIEKILYDEYLIDKEIKKLEDEIERLNRLKNNDFS